MRLKVRTYMMAAFALTAMAPLLVFWLWPYSGILAKRYEEVWERHLLIAENLGAAMDIYHRDLIASMTSFAGPISEGGGDEARPIFENLHFRHLCVVDVGTGQVLRTFLSETYACPDVVPRERMAAFLDLADKDRVGLSGVVAPNGDLPRIFLVTRVDDLIVVGAVHTDFFLNLQRRISFGRLGHAAIVDHTGRVLAHPIDEWAANARDLSGIAPVARMMKGETGVDTFFSPAMELDMVAGFTSLPASGWGVMVPQPTNELDEVAAIFNRDALIILSLGLLFSFAVAALASQLLSYRIRSIGAQVSEIGKEHVVSGDSPPYKRLVLRELSALEDGVNQMAGSVIQAKTELETRNDELQQTNTRLTAEMKERETAQRLRAASEAQFNTLFEDVPVPIRVEDLSGVARAVRRLGISDRDEMRRYLDENPDFLMECRDAIVVIDANKAAQELHRYPSKDSMVSGVVQRLRPDSQQILRRTILAIHKGQPRMDYELTVYPKSGEPRRVSSTWTATPGYEESYERILLTSVDITDAIKAEERLLTAQKMEAVGQLTGGVAHDFNNLLTVIGGHIELIQEDMENAAHYIPPVLRAVSQGAQLTQHLLAFSRQQPLAPKTVDMVQLVNDAAEVFRRTLGTNIKITFEHDADVWMARADPAQLQNALLNLALNARDELPDGGDLLISCQNFHAHSDGSDDLEAGDYVKVSVRDSGPGMSPEVQARVFEPFFSTKEVGKGSGLGLSMVYGFAKQSRGLADVHSEEGLGTTVSIYLPRAKDDVLCAEENTASDWETVRSGKQILVLEDQPDVRAYLLRALNKAGYDPVAAEDAHAARAALKANPNLKLALCDIMLPNGVSGIEFARTARQERADLKVIFLSGHPPKTDASLQESFPDSPILAKPIETTALLSALKRAAEEE